MPCTTILVGKKASYDGSTLMARNEDSCEGNFAPKKFIVVQPSEQPRHYKSKISKVEIDLPDNPMRYTAMPNALPDQGIWGEAGFNEENIAMSETETITSNARVLGADPLVKGGIGEEDFLTLVLPYIHSAREGVLRLGALLEEFGTYEMNGVGFQDLDEIWWMETIGGHHYIAKRCPDDSYVVMPNQMGIDFFDLKDAFSSQKNHMCSKDLLEFIENNHLDASFHKAPLAEVKDFDARAAFGSHDDSDHTYNTPRAWFMERYLNPNTYKWEGKNPDFGPESDNIPWCLVPEHKITIEDIKYVLSAHFQGTEYDPYCKHNINGKRGMYRTIGVNRTNFVAVTQLRPYVPDEIKAVEWIAEGSNPFNALVPFYGNINQTPAYLRNTGKKVTTENFYWVNRLIGAIADSDFYDNAIHIERYQNKMSSKGHEFLNKFDKEFIENKPANAPDFLEKCNQEIADFAKAETYDVLDKVLYTSSLNMKNDFARSDA